MSSKIQNKLVLTADGRVLLIFRLKHKINSGQKVRSLDEIYRAWKVLTPSALTKTAIDKVYH